MNRNTIESKETERMMASWYRTVSGDCRLNPYSYGAWDLALWADKNYLVEVKGLSYTQEQIRHFNSLFYPALKLQTLAKMGYPVLVAYTSCDGWTLEIPVDPQLDYLTKEIQLIQGWFSTTVTNYLLPQIGKWSKVANSFPVAKERWSKR